MVYHYQWTGMKYNDMTVYIKLYQCYINSIPLYRYTIIKGNTSILFSWYSDRYNGINKPLKHFCQTCHNILVKLRKYTKGYDVLFMALNIVQHYLTICSKLREKKKNCTKVIFWRVPNKKTLHLKEIELERVK